MAVACIDGQLLKLIESQSWFACLLLGWLVFWAVLLTWCSGFLNVFGFVYYTGSHQSSAHPLNFQNGSMPPFEQPVFEDEILSWPSGGMPLARSCSF